MAIADLSGCAKLITQSMYGKKKGVMLSGAKRIRNISDFSGRLGFREKRGMTLGLCENFNAQALKK